MSERNAAEIHLLRDLGNNPHLLTSEQRAWYQNAHSPFKPNATLWYPDQYREHANLIIHAEPCFTQRYCLCGAGRGRCGHREFCHRCADLDWRAKFAAFEHCFYKATWTFLTISFSGGINLEDTGAQEDALAHTNAIKEEFDEWLKDFSIPGAIISDEMAVLSFLPCKVLPHAHALANGTEISETMRADLENRITHAVRNQIGSSALTARVFLTAIKDDNG